MELGRYLIYGLVDPVTSHLRYVGQSSVGALRPLQHIQPCRLKGRSHKVNWIRSLLSAGLAYKIVVIQVLDDPEGLSDAEIGWIAYFREMGCPLTNATDGGEGCRGTKQTPEHIRRRTSGAIGRPLPQGVREKISKTLHGRKRGPLSEEHKIKIARGRQAKPFRDQFGNVYTSVRAAARRLGLHHSNILQVLKQGCGSLKGYTFSYVEESTGRNLRG